MQSAATVLGVLRERGRRGLPLDELYRQLFNPQLYLLAYGRIYANHGAMTPGVTQETVDGMSQAKISRIIAAMRHERYRFQPVRRTYIPKKNGKNRPLGLPSRSDKLVGEVIRLLLEAYYEPRFSDRSHGYRPRRGCHTALAEVADKWTGTTWLIEGDISDCFGSLDPHDPGYRRLRYVRYCDLCRARHKSAYAQCRIMPIAGCRCWSAGVRWPAARHNPRCSGRRAGAVPLERRARGWSSDQGSLFAGEVEVQVDPGGWPQRLVAGFRCLLL